MAKQAKRRSAKKKQSFNVTNELLALLLVVAIGMSFIDFFSGTGVTGYGTSDMNATASVEISSVTAINWTTASIDWGVGSVTSPGPAVLDTSAGTVTLGNWSAITEPLVLENIGGDDVSLSLWANETADVLFSGSSPAFKWKFANNETDACTGLTDTSFTDVNTTSPGTTICSVFFANDTKDAINMDIQLTIPADATPGAKSAVITATGTA
jgi:hypothetical protein